MYSVLKKKILVTYQRENRVLELHVQTSKSHKYFDFKTIKYIYKRALKTTQ